MQLPEQSIKLPDWELGAIVGQVISAVDEQNAFDALLPFATALIDHPLRDAADSAYVLNQLLTLLSDTLATDNVGYYLGGGAGAKELAKIYDQIMPVVEHFMQAALQCNDEIFAKRYRSIVLVECASLRAANQIFGDSSTQAMYWRAKGVEFATRRNKC